MKADNKAKLMQQADSDHRNALETAENGEYMRAAFHAASALRSYSRLNDSEKIQELKALVVEYNSKSEPLKKFDISVTFTKKQQNEWEELISSFVGAMSKLHETTLRLSSKDRCGRKITTLPLLTPTM